MADDLIEFYPNQKYLDKKWKPERFSNGSLSALAQAERMARDSGVLSSNLAGQLLPNALTEGWDRFGIVGGRYGYPVAPHRDKVLGLMGLKVGEMNDVDPVAADIVRDSKNGYWINRNIQDQQRQVGIAAKLAAVILAEKARLYGEDKAIERWNGQGKAMEHYEGMQIPANASNHAAKVAEMSRMLQHPSNANIFSAYQKLLQPPTASPFGPLDLISVSDPKSTMLPAVPFGS